MNHTRQPVKRTYSQIIIDHLMTGGRISTWDAYELYNITCLAQRVSDLRKAGVPIQSEMVTRNDKRFSIYWLESDYIEATEATQTNHNDSMEGV